MIKRFFLFLFGCTLLISVIAGGYYWFESKKYPKPDWTEVERMTIASLWLGDLPPLGKDPSNSVADNLEAATFGHQLFFDKRFSGNGQVACATCHQPEKYFTDGQALATGMGITGRSSPSIVGTAYHPFIFWDGRADSQWAQALGPMESDVEHGGSRLQYAHLIASDKNYRQQYESLFGAMPDLSDSSRFPPKAGPVNKRSLPEVANAWNAMNEDDRELVTRVYVNMGKSIAAYERLILPDMSRFDTYAVAIRNNSTDGLDSLSRDEVEGLRLFIGDGRCIECHNGPLFSNDDFANIGTPTPKGSSFDFGRSIGVNKVIKAEFNCMSKYSDAERSKCFELRFIKRVGDDLAGSFKSPSLRNVTQTAPYMHAGQMKDLDEVLEHYNEPPTPPFGHTMLTKLELEPYQLEQLKQFLQSLDSGVAADIKWLIPPKANILKMPAH